MKSKALQKLAAELRDHLADELHAQVESMPERIDGFRIVRVIASGGMGTVYEAEQSHPNRRVALKILRQGITSRSAMRRFRFETEALARLNHPGIATVYQSGTYDDGSGAVPYFAMQLVEDARDIRTYCNEKDLSIARRLELFAKVADAVHHGHQKSIVHRDLKPSNILVDGEGQPKVIDFGIARSTDADLTLTTMHTDVGQIIGTIAYMSPEQCSGQSRDVDVTSDVYALGVVLYGILCERLPYNIDGLSHTQVMRIIEERPPIQPSTLDKRFRGNIDAIVLMALSKKQRDRYQSAGDLAKEIRRHLRSEPIMARPPSHWQKTVRWMGRHPLVVTIAACLTIVTLALSATHFAVQYQLNHPHHVMMSDDRTHASVHSAGDRIMRDWIVEDKGDIAGIEMIGGTGKYEGDKIVVIGFSPDQRTPHPGALVAYNASRSFEEPIWMVRLTEDELPPRVIAEGDTASQFGIKSVSAMDVFDAVPGDELIVVHSHSPGSWRCLRIYGPTDGRLLSQLWHDGSIADPTWFPRHELLVVAGDNKEVLWTKRGIPLEAYPIVCFAVHPILDHIETGFFGTSHPFDSPCIRWYKVLLPADAAPVTVAGHLQRPFETEDTANYVRLLINDDSAKRCVSWLVSVDGVLVVESAEPDDDYKIARDQGAVPDPDIFYLDDLPPVISP